MRSAPPKAESDRFLADLNRLTGATARFGLCISGGPDSIALLLFAHAAGLDCEAATVDHGLRPEAADEARFVGKIARDLSLPHQIICLTGQPKGNVSAWARQERYRALTHWAAEQGLDYLLTAHHADDQLETMIMRLNRGSGLPGLSAIRGVNGRIVRPLLGWRKAELEALTRQCGIQAIEDPSNSDDRFDRARLRKALAQADWLDPVAASRSAEALAEADDALNWTAEAYMNRRTATQNDILSFDPRSLPRELLRRILLRCIKQFNPTASPRGDELDRLLLGLAAGRTATLSGVKCVGGDFWLFSRAPLRRTV